MFWYLLFVSDIWSVFILFMYQLVCSFWRSHSFYVYPIFMIVCASICLFVLCIICSHSGYHVKTNRCSIYAYPRLIRFFCLPASKLHICFALWTAYSNNWTPSLNASSLTICFSRFANMYLDFAPLMIHQHIYPACETSPYNCWFVGNFRQTASPGPPCVYPIVTSDCPLGKPT